MNFEDKSKALEKYGKEWLKRSYGDMQLIVSMIDELKE